MDFIPQSQMVIEGEARTHTSMAGWAWWDEHGEMGMVGWAWWDEHDIMHNM
jgi:hypothetical protein